MQPAPKGTAASPTPAEDNGQLQQQHHQQVPILYDKYYTQQQQQRRVAQSVKNQQQQHQHDETITGGGVARYDSLPQLKPSPSSSHGINSNSNSNTRGAAGAGAGAALLHSINGSSLFVGGTSGGGVGSSTGNNHHHPIDNASNDKNNNNIINHTLNNNNNTSHTANHNNHRNNNKDEAADNNNDDNVITVATLPSLKSTATAATPKKREAQTFEGGSSTAAKQQQNQQQQHHHPFHYSRRAYEPSPLKGDLMPRPPLSATAAAAAYASYYGGGGEGGGGSGASASSHQQRNSIYGVGAGGSGRLSLTSSGFLLPSGMTNTSGSRRASTAAGSLLGGVGGGAAFSPSHHNNNSASSASLAAAMAARQNIQGTLETTMASLTERLAKYNTFSQVLGEVKRKDEEDNNSPTAASFNSGGLSGLLGGPHRRSSPPQRMGGGSGTAEGLRNASVVAVGGGVRPPPPRRSTAAGASGRNASVAAAALTADSADPANRPSTAATAPTTSHHQRVLSALSSVPTYAFIGHRPSTANTSLKTTAGGASASGVSAAGGGNLRRGPDKSDFYSASTSAAPLDPYASRRLSSAGADRYGGGSPHRNGGASGYYDSNNHDGGSADYGGGGRGGGGFSENSLVGDPTAIHFTDNSLMTSLLSKFNAEEKRKQKEELLLQKQKKGAPNGAAGGVNAGDGVGGGGGGGGGGSSTSSPLLGSTAAPSLLFHLPPSRGTSAAQNKPRPPMMPANGESSTDGNGSVLEGDQPSPSVRFAVVPNNSNNAGGVVESSAGGGAIVGMQQSARRRSTAAAANHHMNAAAARKSSLTNNSRYTATLPLVPSPPTTDPTAGSDASAAAVRPRSTILALELEIEARLRHIRAGNTTSFPPSSSSMAANNSTSSSQQQQHVVSDLVRSLTGEATHLVDDAPFLLWLSENKERATDEAVRGEARRRHNEIVAQQKAARARYLTSWRADMGAEIAAVAEEEGWGAVRGMGFDVEGVAEEDYYHCEQQHGDGDDVNHHLSGDVRGDLNDDDDGDEDDYEYEEEEYYYEEEVEEEDEEEIASHTAVEEGATCTSTPTATTTSATPHAPQHAAAAATTTSPPLIGAAAGARRNRQHLPTASFSPQLEEKEGEGEVGDHRSRHHAAHIPNTQQRRRSSQAGCAIVNVDSAASPSQQTLHQQAAAQSRHTVEQYQKYKMSGRFDMSALQRPYFPPTPSSSSSPPKTQGGGGADGEPLLPLRGFEVDGECGDDDDDGMEYEAPLPPPRANRLADPQLISSSTSATTVPRVPTPPPINSKSPSFSPPASYRRKQHGMTSPLQLQQDQRRFNNIHNSPIASSSHSPSSPPLYEVGATSPTTTAVGSSSSAAAEDPSFEMAATSTVPIRGVRKSTAPGDETATSTGDDSSSLLMTAAKAQQLAWEVYLAGFKSAEEKTSLHSGGDASSAAAAVGDGAPSSPLTSQKKAAIGHQKSGSAAAAAAAGAGLNASTANPSGTMVALGGYLQSQRETAQQQQQLKRRAAAVVGDNHNHQTGSSPSAAQIVITHVTDDDEEEDPIVGTHHSAHPPPGSVGASVDGAAGVGTFGSSSALLGSTSTAADFVSTVPAVAGGRRHHQHLGGATGSGTNLHSFDVSDGSSFNHHNGSFGGKGNAAMMMGSSSSFNKNASTTTSHHHHHHHSSSTTAATASRRILILNINDGAERHALRQWIGGGWQHHTHHHEEAALKIQSVIRVYIAKKRVAQARFRRRELIRLRLAEEEKNEATWNEMMAAYRERERAVVAAAAAASSNSALPFEEQRKLKHYYEQTLIAKVHHMRRARERRAKEKEELETYAATRIQSIFRGFMARRDAEYLRHPELLAAKILAKRNKCALKIQRLYKGHATRKSNAERRAAAIRIQCAFRRFLARSALRAVRDEKLRGEQDEVRSFAAVVIQEWYRERRDRRYLARLVAGRVLELCHRVGRGYLGRTEAHRLLQKKRNADFKLLQSYIWHSIGVREVIRRKIRLCAAITIQSLFRGHRDRTATRRRKAEAAAQALLAKQLDAAVLIQSTWRGHHQRSADPTPVNTPRRLQDIDATVAADNALKSPSDLQWEAEEEAARQRLIEEESALILQTATRRYLALLARERRQKEIDDEIAFGVQTDAANILFRFYRNHIRQRKLREATVAAARVIQRALSVCVALRKVGELRSRTPSLLNTQIQHDAAICIQKCANSYLARLHLQKALVERKAEYRRVEESEAAMVIQRSYRMCLSRRWAAALFRSEMSHREAVSQLIAMESKSRDELIKGILDNDRTAPLKSYAALITIPLLADRLRALVAEEQYHRCGEVKVVPAKKPTKDTATDAADGDAAEPLTISTPTEASPLNSPLSGAIPNAAIDAEEEEEQIDIINFNAIVQLEARDRSKIRHAAAEDARRLGGANTDRRIAAEKEERERMEEEAKVAAALAAEKAAAAAWLAVAEVLSAEETAARVVIVDSETALFTEAAAATRESIRCRQLVEAEENALKRYLAEREAARRFDEDCVRQSRAINRSVQNIGGCFDWENQSVVNKVFLAVEDTMAAKRRKHSTREGPQGATRGSFTAVEGGSVVDLDEYDDDDEDDDDAPRRGPLGTDEITEVTTDPTVSQLSFRKPRRSVANGGNLSTTAADDVSNIDAADDNHEVASGGGAAAVPPPSSSSPPIAAAKKPHRGGDDSSTTDEDADDYYDIETGSSVTAGEGSRRPSHYSRRQSNHHSHHNHHNHQNADANSTTVAVGDIASPPPPAAAVVVVAAAAEKSPHAATDATAIDAQQKEAPAGDDGKGAAPLNTAAPVVEPSQPPTALAPPTPSDPQPPQALAEDEEEPQPLPPQTNTTTADVAAAVVDGAVAAAMSSTSISVAQSSATSPSLSISLSLGGGGVGGESMEGSRGMPATIDDDGGGGDAVIIGGGNDPLIPSTPPATIPAPSSAVPSALNGPSPASQSKQQQQRPESASMMSMAGPPPPMNRPSTADPSSSAAAHAEITAAATAAAPSHAKSPDAIVAASPVAAEGVPTEKKAVVVVDTQPNAAAAAAADDDTSSVAFSNSNTNTAEANNGKSNTNNNNNKAAAPTASPTASPATAGAADVGGDDTADLLDDFDKDDADTDDDDFLNDLDDLSDMEL